MESTSVETLHCLCFINIDACLAKYEPSVFQKNWNLTPIFLRKANERETTLFNQALERPG